MYEVTISATKEQSYLLNHVKNTLSNYVSQIDGVQAMINNKRRSYYTLACADTFTEQLRRSVAESVSQVLCVGCKNIFVRDLLNIEQCNFYQNVMINTLCVFDSKYDNHMMKHVIDTECNIFIDGYYNFRLKDFKSKWANVINMVLENNFVLQDDQLILEFLQYLLESVDNSVEKLSICFDEGDFFLCDSRNNVIDKSLTLAKNCTAEEESMVNAICLNPKRVSVYYHDKPSADFCQMMDQLFTTEFIKVQ